MIQSVNSCLESGTNCAWTHARFLKMARGRAESVPDEVVSFLTGNSWDVLITSPPPPQRTSRPEKHCGMMWAAERFGGVLRHEPQRKATGKKTPHKLPKQDLGENNDVIQLWEHWAERQRLRSGHRAQRHSAPFHCLSDLLSNMRCASLYRSVNMYTKESNRGPVVTDIQHRWKVEAGASQLLSSFIAKSPPRIYSTEIKRKKKNATSPLSITSSQ